MQNHPSLAGDASQDQYSTSPSCCCPSTVAVGTGAALDKTSWCRAVGLDPRGEPVVHLGLVVQLALLDLRVQRCSVRVRDEQQQEDARHFRILRAGGLARREECARPQAAFLL